MLINSLQHAHQAIFQVMKQPDVPSYAHLIFHWSLIKQTALPAILHSRASEVKMRRLTISESYPDDIENWLLLSQAEQFLGSVSDTVDCMNRAETAPVPETLSEVDERRLSCQFLRQKASLALWESMSTAVFDDAREMINMLFDRPEGGSLEDILLRAALEMHCAAANRDDLSSVVLHGKAAMADLEAALPSDPVVIGVCLKFVKRKMDEAQTALQQSKMYAPIKLKGILESEVPVMNYALVQVDLAASYCDKKDPLWYPLNELAADVYKEFQGRILKINSLENGPRRDLFFTYKVLRASMNVQNVYDRKGVFTENTYMTLIPGPNILSRSQDSMLYALSCHGDFGRHWYDKLKKGICLGGAVAWLAAAMKGTASDYFEQLDKVVRQTWDDDVRKLFRRIMICQFGNYAQHTGLACWQNSVLTYDQRILSRYLGQLANSSVGILFSSGTKILHAVAAVINPPPEQEGDKPPFGRFYCFNVESGDLDINNMSDLISLVFKQLEKNIPISIELFGLPDSEKPKLAAESHWVKEMISLSDEMRSFMLKRVAQLQDNALTAAWNSTS